MKLSNEQRYKLNARIGSLTCDYIINRASFKHGSITEAEYDDAQKKVDQGLCMLAKTYGISERQIYYNFTKFAIKLILEYYRQMKSIKSILND